MTEINTTEIRVTAILGSAVPNCYTGRALALALDEVRRDAAITLELIDPREFELALPGRPGDPAQVERLQRMVAAATGVIIATPEYHGSYSSTIKLIIDNLGFPSVLSGKPIVLLGAADGQIGAIKALEHLRSVCSHIGGLVLPGPVSIAGVRSVFTADGRCTDAAIERRVRGLARNLIDFIHNHICPRIALEEMVREGKAVRAD